MRNKNVELREKVIGQLKTLNTFGEDPVNLEMTINNSLMSLSILIDRTYEELLLIFTEEEMQLLVRCFCGTMFPHGCPFKFKKLLLAEVSEIVSYLEIDHGIIDKINGLTEFQSFTLLLVSIQQRAFKK